MEPTDPRLREIALGFALREAHREAESIHTFALYLCIDAGLERLPDRLYDEAYRAATNALSTALATKTLPPRLLAVAAEVAQRAATAARHAYFQPLPESARVITDPDTAEAAYRILARALASVQARARVRRVTLDRATVGRVARTGVPVLLRGGDQPAGHDLPGVTSMATVAVDPTDARYVCVHYRRTKELVSTTELARAPRLMLASLY